MDPQRFDAFVCRLGAVTSRRAVAALLTGIIAPLLSASAMADRRGKSNKKRAGKGEERRSRGAGTRRGKNRRQGGAVRAEAACYSGSPCIPGQGAYLTKCDLSGSTALKNVNCKACNLSGASLKSADASGANLTQANLSKACLVDADLSGAALTGANTTDALFCRTKMPSGSINNSGCSKGTTCCPACDAAHPCPAGQRCCNGKCFAGDCCATAECTDPAKPVCLNHDCSPCTTSQQCSAGKICCNGRCQSGVCCTAADCPDRQCETKSCTGSQCVYTPVASGAGSLCATQCCRGTCIPHCTASDQCHSPGVCDPATGTCTNPAVADGTACNDGNACTQTDTCQGGECVGGNSIVCAASGQCNNPGVCSPATGTCSLGTPKPDGSPCDDGNACTQTDTCLSGTCVGGNPVVCESGSACVANADNQTCCCPPPPTGFATHCRISPSGNKCCCTNPNQICCDRDGQGNCQLASCT